MISLFSYVSAPGPLSRYRVLALADSLSLSLALLRSLSPSRLGKSRLWTILCADELLRFMLDLHLVGKYSWERAADAATNNFTLCRAGPWIDAPKTINMIRRVARQALSAAPIPRQTPRRYSKLLEQLPGAFVVLVTHRPRCSATNGSNLEKYGTTMAKVGKQSRNKTKECSWEYVSSNVCPGTGAAESHCCACRGWFRSM